MMETDQNIGKATRSLNEEMFWHAVEARDARFDGLFFYAVGSTGIYCRPSCPSRRPGRAGVRFFEACEEAESNGFRSCLRCCPREASARNPRVEMVMRACRLIESDSEGMLRLGALSEKLGVGAHHFHKTFKSITGITPRQYADARRLDRFKSRVRESGDVAGALYDAGYGSSSRLYEKSSGRLGMTPAVYGRGGKGMRISYVIVESPLGRMLVAATVRGVCAVNFGDDDEGLASSLAAEYPAAEIARDVEEGLSNAVEALLAHLSGAQPHLDLPLDVQATAFQMRVWEELRKIPYGATRSYAEVAKSIEQPTATRAVARACATNPVALVTPCHRVVRGDGSLSGYRWGVERKRKLLEREREDGRAKLAASRS